MRDNSIIINNIRHQPVFNEKGRRQIEKEYNARYVITTALGMSNVAYDIFYVKKPQKEYKNRYIAMGIFEDRETGELVPTISDGDKVCEFEFLTIEDNGIYYYSRYRNDYVGTPNGYAIDGGRAYNRCLCKKGEEPKLKGFVVKDGEMKETPKSA